RIEARAVHQRAGTLPNSPLPVHERKHFFRWYRWKHGLPDQFRARARWPFIGTTRIGSAASSSGDLQLGAMLNDCRRSAPGDTDNPTAHTAAPTPASVGALGAASDQRGSASASNFAANSPAGIL